MRITVASGKGGTGKTTIATSLALSLASAPKGPPELLFLDCDVEAPNAHIFLKPRLERRQKVGLLIPKVDESKCTYCGRCAEVCPWHAIAVVGKKTLVFPQLCHGCGSCTLACPEGAIQEVLNPIGVMEAGPAQANGSSINGEGFAFGHGILDVGEPMAVPIIRQLKKWFPEQPEQVVIIDASPGTTCPVVESMRGSDFVLLVTEPTPFGLHDLRLAAQLTRELEIPAGVVINRDGLGDQGVEEYCRQSELPVLMRVPFDQEIAEGIARGRPLVDIQPAYVEAFQKLYAQIITMTSSLGR